MSAAPGPGGKPLRQRIEVRQVMGPIADIDLCSAPVVEYLLRELAPQVLGRLVRRYGDFAAAEDAVQEALIAAALHWPQDGLPDNPGGWLTRTALRRLTDQHRSEQARRRREVASALQEVSGAEPAQRDDTLALLDERLAGHHRLDAVRGHLYEMLGDRDTAATHYRAAVARTPSEPERRYLLMQVARMAVP